MIVCDAETDDDLRAIAEAAARLQGRAVWVGSAGLAHELLGAIGLTLSEADAVSQLPETYWFDPFRSRKRQPNLLASR